MSLSLAKKVTLLVSVPVVLEVVMVGALTFVLTKVEGARARAAHANTLSTDMNTLLTGHMRRLALRMVRKMTDLDDNGADELALMEKHRELIAHLSDATSRSPSERKMWDEIMRLGSGIDSSFEAAKTAYDKGDKVGAGIAWSTAQGDLNRLMNIGTSMAVDADANEAASQREYETYGNKLKAVLLGSILSSVLLAFALAYLFNKSTTTRLNMLTENAILFSTGGSPQHTLDGDDELAQLDNTYQEMAHQVQLLRQKERAILDNTAEVMCSLDRRLRLRETNRAFASWGYSDEAVHDTSVLEIVAPEDAEFVYQKLQDCISSRKQFKFDAQMLTFDAQKFDVEWSVVWSDAEQSLFCVIRDISERKVLEQMKQDFVAMISHDLRTPLSSVLAAIELVGLPHFGISDEGQTQLQLAERNLHSSISLINQLLEVEKMESGVVNLDYQPTNSLTIINAALTAVSGASQKNRCTIECLPKDANCDLFVDPEKMIRVITNLLANAVKYSDAGAAIQIVQQISANTFRLSVIDNGRGISPDKLHLVFEKYKQAEPEDRREKAGTGLGLAICKAIVEAHQGQIGVSSRGKNGSTFWFEIPFQKA